MWNYRGVLARNGSLCNSTASLTTKHGYLQRCVPSTLRKRLLKTDVLSIKEHSTTEKFGKCSNYIFTASTKVTPASITDVSIRRFHTCLTKFIADTNDTIQSEPPDTRKLNAKINIHNLFRENDLDISGDFIESITERIEKPKKKPAKHYHVRSQNLSIRDIERMYPTPKHTLHNVYQSVKNETRKLDLIFDFVHVKESSAWQCTLKVFWPEEMTFTTKSNNKMAAANAASYKCLHWLEINNRINKGMPIIHTANDIEDVVKRPVTLSVKKESLNAAKIILDKYEENIQSIVSSPDNSLHFQQHSYQDGAIIDPVGKSNPANRNPDKLNKRNELLLLRYNHRKSIKSSTDLPISDFREQIIDEIERNPVVVIKGDTGCGKTTQVPQFIMDSFIERGEAINCNMIVSQPRRISAISLAERMADERQEQVGDVVGYQVRLSQELPNTPAGILFCTTGILLRKLQFNPTLEGCTHVIIDEAHERSINTDMLLVLLKRALQQRPSLKVIIMSATINAELFQSYFDCSVIEVPGRAYRVEMNFLEDIDKLELRSPSRWDLSFENVEKETGGPTPDIVKMGELISLITRKQPPGAILCFLPGWSEISKMKKYLEDYSFLPKNELLIVPVHSKMSYHDQRKIFSKPPTHVRKIVLATDIAETGITVSDVVYVVDSCTQRQLQWHEKRGFSSIENQWASQANINQRKGRAGRVKPGVSYHFITRDKFQRLPRHPAPEVMRASLEKTVLDAKTYSPEKAVDFLGSMPQPPEHSIIRQAVQNLVDLGALDNHENLTPLGKRISLFTLNPQLSKAIVYSSIFQCLSPMITIASIMSGESEIFAGVLHNKSAIRDVKTVFHPTSDHISVAWMFQQWYSLYKSNRQEAYEFAFTSHLVPEKMFTLSKIREINAEHLFHAQMLPNFTNLDDMSARVNEYAELDELCRGVLLSGLDQVLHQRNFDIRKGQLKKGTQTFVMEDGSRATITPESINFKRKHWPSPFITYVQRTHSEERRTSLIRETSVISPLTVFLFSQAQITGYVHNKSKINTQEDSNSDNNNNNNNNNNKNINNDNETEILFTMNARKNVRLICNKETADVLLYFRDAMWSVVRYLVANYGVTQPDNTRDFEQVEAFKIEMLEVLSKMLSEASELIDKPTPHNNTTKNKNQYGGYNNVKY